MSRYQEVAIEESAVEESYRGFDGEEDDSARGPLILALAVGVLVVFGAVIWNTYRAGVRSEDGGVPSVLADTTQYKRAPDDPGGIEVPDTEKRFYDQIDASERAVAKPASLAPATVPEPVLVGGPPMDLRPDLDAEAVTTAPEPALAEMAAKPASLPPAASAAGPQLESTQFPFKAEGQFLVQVAAYRSEEAAESAWQKSTKAHPALYRGASRQIQKADLGAKGVFYRLRIGAFAERAEAAAFCEALKESGSTCIVVTG